MKKIILIYLALIANLSSAETAVLLSGVDTFHKQDQQCSLNVTFKEGEVVRIEAALRGDKSSPNSDDREVIPYLKLEGRDLERLIQYKQGEITNGSLTLSGEYKRDGVSHRLNVLFRNNKSKAYFSYIQSYNNWLNRRQVSALAFSCTVAAEYVSYEEKCEHIADLGLRTHCRSQAQIASLRGHFREPIQAR
ncbi:MAG: hypothetical protein AB7F86_13595 [Bdellovibrionales bacterium]